MFPGALEAAGRSRMNPDLAQEVWALQPLCSPLTLSESHPAHWGLVNYRAWASYLCVSLGYCEKQTKLAKSEALWKREHHMTSRLDGFWMAVGAFSLILPPPHPLFSCSCLTGEALRESHP